MAGNGNNSKEHINQVMNESVAEKTNVPSATEAITKLNLQSHTAFIDADPYIANPYALLGMVLQIRKQNGQCPTNLADPTYMFEFTPFPIKREVDELSKLKEPKLRSSIVVDQHLAANVSFLSYLQAELTADSFFSLMVFDQSAGVVDQHHPDWAQNVQTWKSQNKDLLDDPEICYLFAISGFIQKNIVRKKYKKFDASAKGGAYGLNVGGELTTSTDEYSLDIKFGISPIILKRPGATTDPHTLVLSPNAMEKELFAGLTGSTIQQQYLRKE